MNRLTILENFRTSIHAKKPIVGVSLGGGRSAFQAESGGADFLLALNAGRFRMSGVASTAAMLPFSNSNDMVFDFASKEVLPRVKQIPVIFGACAQDPTHSHHELIDQLINKGFSGINNFPTVALIDGQYRQFLEENGEGFDVEVDLLKKAVEKGIFTVAFAVTLEEAVAMAKANVDILCLHFGWTYISRKKNELSLLEEMIQKANAIFKVVTPIKPSIIKMIYGGAVVRNPEMLARFYKETSAVGFIGGSVFEVMPVENSIKDATDRFKNLYKVSELEKENERLRQELIKQKGVQPLIGSSSLMQEVKNLIRKVTNDDASLLIEGESGTGKDLVVKMIHFGSQRATKPFVKVNCASIPKNLMESELFGYEKGAFVGADVQHIGRFETAHEGTLFLDNITELDNDLQAKLLRVIQDHEFERVGGGQTIHIDVRIIATTNKNIKEELRAKRFREDLYYLLNVMTLHMPPLRAHKEDIPELVSFLLKEMEEKQGQNLSVSPAALAALMAYDWPGNVRELRNILSRGFLLSTNSVLNVTDLPSPLQGALVSDPTANVIRQSAMIVEKELIKEELIKARWNQTKAAQALGMTRRNLYNKIKKYGLEK